MYAILDIETTGGQFNEEGITEIAIYRFDGHEVTDQFISLINPEIPIQPFVVKLTGINNAMLRSAPKFFEVAKRIIEITKDCVIVAHNAEFDYRILRTEFKRLGYDFERESLCTVELSKKLLPDQLSYSLGKLVRSLGIPMSDRHRATGDALATVQLFKLLLAKDSEKEIIKSFIKTGIKTGLSPKLLDLAESVPSVTGVYYLHRENGDLMYIGSSKNIKKSVNRHFTGSSGKSRRIRKEVFAVSYEETGSELIAHLKEVQEVKINRPAYNNGPKKEKNFSWAMYAEKNAGGFLTLKLLRTDGRKKDLALFTSFREGRNALPRIAEKHNLLHENTDLQKFVLTESPAEYNSRALEFIGHNRLNGRSLVVIDKGRTIDERSAVLIEDGVYKGYAFFSLNYQVNNIDILKNIITPMDSSRDILNIIRDYIQKKKIVKIVSF